MALGRPRTPKGATVKRLYFRFKACSVPDPFVHDRVVVQPDGETVALVDRDALAKGILEVDLE